MRAFAANSVFSGSTDRQLDATAAVATATQTSSLMTTVAGDHGAACGGGASGGAGLVVDDDRATGDVAQLALDASSSSRWNPCTSDALGQAVLARRAYFSARR